MKELTNKAITFLINDVYNEKPEVYLRLDSSENTPIFTGIISENTPESITKAIKDMTSLNVNWYDLVYLGSSDCRKDIKDLINNFYAVRINKFSLARQLYETEIREWFFIDNIRKGKYEDPRILNNKNLVYFMQILSMKFYNAV